MSAPTDLSLRSIDLLTLGELMLRLSVPPVSLLVDAPDFQVHVAGTESNVAVAVARMGFNARWLSRLTANALGERITRTLEGYGVDCSSVLWTDEDRVGTYYVEFGTAPRPTRVVYDRKHSAASKMRPGMFDLNLIAQSKTLHLTGITAALSSDCRLLQQQMIAAARQHSTRVVYDVNYRGLLWSPTECRDCLEPLLQNVDVLILSQRDAQGIFGITGSPQQMLEQLYARFKIGDIALTLGDQGAMSLSGGRILHVPAYPVQMVDRIGAGDSFAAGVICGLLENNYELGLRYGVAMSALQLTLSGDIFRLSRPDVLQLMQTGNTTSLIR